MKKQFYLLVLCVLLLQNIHAQYVINGNASHISGSQYQLTPAINTQSGSVWYQTKLNLNYDFSISAALYFGTKDASGADGIAFVLQPLSVNAGASGGGIGYSGIAPSLNVEFDTWYNSDFVDPLSDHLGINKNGNVVHAGSDVLLPPSLLPNIEDGAWHNTMFEWNAATKTFTVTFDGVPYVIVYDMQANIFGGDPFVYWGFTAGTGAANNDQRVDVGTIFFIEEITIQGEVTDIYCPGSSTGEIDINATGGTGDYDYSWTGPNSFSSSDENISNIPAGTYTVTVTDDSNVSNSESFTVNEYPDNTDPEANCQNATVTLSNGTATVTPDDVDDNSTDNCGIQSMTVEPNTFDCSDIGDHTVTLTVNDFNGNSSTCTATVTVEGETTLCEIIPIPSNNIYTGGVPNNIYLGYGPQSVTLSVVTFGGNAISHSWTGNGTLSCTSCPSPVFAPTTPGTYEFTVTIANENGCTSTCIVTICVMNVQAPGNNKVYVCHIAGNGNANTLSISPNAVAAHIGGHPSDRLGICFQFPCVNARMADKEEEIMELSNMSVYPNPSNGKFSVQLHGISGVTADLTIIDANGILVEKNSIEITDHEQSLELDLSEKAAGLYLIRLVTEEDVYTNRIVIKP
jgi:hypothetical protein